MNPEQLAFLEMYKEHAAQARQHENQRERMTALIVALGGAVVAFAFSDAGSEPFFRTVAGVILLILGLFGALFAYKHYERNRMHTRIMGEFRDRLEETLQQAPLGAIRNGGERAHDQDFKCSSRWSLHCFWEGMNLGVAVLGFALIMFVLGADSGMEQSNQGLTPAVGAQP